MMVAQDLACAMVGREVVGDDMNNLMAGFVCVHVEQVDATF